VLGNRLYAIGGVGDINNPPQVEYATINPDGTLQPFQPAGFGLNFPRYYLGVIATATQVYVVGGEGASGNFFPQDTIEYAPLLANGTMAPFVTSSNALSEPRAFFQSAVAGRHLFLVGGYNGEQQADIDEAVVDNATGQLGAFAINPVQLPSGTNLEPVFRVGGTLYTMGAGNLATPSGNTQSEHASLNADGTLGSFAADSNSNLQTPLRTGAGAVIGNTYWVFGGQQDQDQGFAILNTIQSAPIDATGTLGAFTQSSATLPDERGSTQAAVIGNNLYLVGNYGFGLPGSAVEQATIYPDGGLGPVTQYGQSLVEDLSGPGLVVYQGSLYVFGGGQGSGSLAHVEAAPILADAGLGSFALVGSMAEGTAALGWAVVGDAIYAFGGYNGSGTLSEVQKMPGLTSDGGASFLNLAGTSLATPTQQFMTSVVGSNLYVLGGTNQSGPITTIQQASLSTGTLGNFTNTANLGSNLNESTVLTSHGNLSLVGGDDSPSENLQSAVIEAPLQ
jgi:hypothetical protein